MQDRSAPLATITPAVQGGVPSARAAGQPRPKAPRNTAVIDAATDGALILQQVMQGQVAPADAVGRFRGLFDTPDIRPRARHRLNLGFGEALARAVRQREEAERSARAARTPAAAQQPANAVPRPAKGAGTIRTRIIDGVEVLDLSGVTDLAQRPLVLAATLDDTLPALDGERLEILRGMVERDRQDFNSRILATIDGALARAQSVSQSHSPSAPVRYVGALARAFGFAIAAASLTGNQRFLDIVVQRTAGQKSVGGFHGLANIARNLLSENAGAPLPARVIANQMLQVVAQQQNLQAGARVAAVDPLVLLPGAGALAVSAGRRLGAGAASTASQTAPRGNVPPARPVANTRNAVDGVFSAAGPGRASIGLPGATIPGGRTRTAIIPRPFTKPDLGGLFSGNTIGDRSRLRSNLLKDQSLDLKRFTGWQAHHVIPWELRTHSLVKRLGMNINHRHNGVPLPETPGGNLSVHFGSHSEYTMAFKAFLNRMRKANLPNDKLGELLADSIERTRQVLISGLPKLRKDNEAPRDLWKKHFKRLGDDLGLLSD